MGKVGGYAKRRLERVMNLVNILVQAFVVHQSVYPVMPSVLYHRADKHLQQQ